METVISNELISFNSLRDIDYGLLKDISIEINFGLAMGFSSRNTKETKPKKVVVQTCSSDGSYAYLEMESMSAKGTLGSLDTDVLNAIITIATEQIEKKNAVELRNQNNPGSIRIYFSLSDICRILGLDPRNMTSMVRESLDKIQTIDVTEKIFKHNATTTRIYNNQVKYRAITDFGHYRGGHANKDIGDFKSIFYLTFHPLVSERIRNGTASANRALYNNVKSGIEKRILSFLEAKEVLFGKTYTFEMDELASVVGFDHQTAYRKRDSIRKHLENLKEETGFFTYAFHKVDGRLNICIEHTDKKEIEVCQYNDSFYSELAFYYGDENLKKLDFTEEDLNLLRSELKNKYSAITGHEYFSFLKQEVDPIELATDISLYQVFKCNYLVQKGIRPLIKHIFSKICTEEVEYPNGYKYFITKRNNETRRTAENEKIKMALQVQKEHEEEELRKFEFGFEKLWNQYKETQPEMIKILLEKASENLNEEDKNLMEPLKSMMVEESAKSFFKKVYREGNLADLVGAAISEHKKQAKIETVKLKSIPEGHSENLVFSV